MNGNLHLVGDAFWALLRWFIEAGLFIIAVVHFCTFIGWHKHEKIYRVLFLPVIVRLSHVILAYWTCFGRLQIPVILTISYLDLVLIIDIFASLESVNIVLNNMHVFFIDRVSGWYENRVPMDSRLNTLDIYVNVCLTFIETLSITTHAAIKRSFKRTQYLIREMFGKFWSKCWNCLNKMTDDSWEKKENSLSFLIL